MMKEVLRKYVVRVSEGPFKGAYLSDKPIGFTEDISEALVTELADAQAARQEASRIIPVELVPVDSEAS